MWPAPLMDFVQTFLANVVDCTSIRAADPKKLAKSQAAIEELGKLRGRPLIYPMIPAGRGSGPFVEMLDGSVKMDLICGIGVHLFGHGHPELMLTGAKAALKATMMQGTLMPAEEYLEVCRLLLKHVITVPHLGSEAQSKLSGIWLSTCGTMANELALKIIRQKKYPAYKLISFKNCFAGRSSTMQELTDEPKYREGQPNFDQFCHIDFFDDQYSVQENISRTCDAIDALLKKEPGQFCGFGFELVQGEGGAFKSAPRDWWQAILNFARSKGLALWFDEVQTFGRTGELFAFQRLGLGEFVDVVTLAKPLHAAAVMWTDDYAPKVGLIAGTFGGSTVNLALGAKIVQMLVDGGYLGPQGRIQNFERYVALDWEERRDRVGKKFNFGRANIYGGMIAFEVLDGKAETIKTLLSKLLDNGVIAFSAGREPVMIRFLPPVGVITHEQWKTAMDVVEKTLGEMS